MAFYNLSKLDDRKKNIEKLREGKSLSAVYSESYVSFCKFFRDVFETPVGLEY